MGQVMVGVRVRGLYWYSSKVRHWQQSCYCSFLEGYSLQRHTILSIQLHLPSLQFRNRRQSSLSKRPEQNVLYPTRTQDCCSCTAVSHRTKNQWHQINLINKFESHNNGMLHISFIHNRLNYVQTAHQQPSIQRIAEPHCLEYHSIIKVEYSHATLFLNCVAAATVFQTELYLGTCTVLPTTEAIQKLDLELLSFVSNYFYILNFSFIAESQQNCFTLLQRVSLFKLYRLKKVAINNFVHPFYFKLSPKSV